jgi:hypothetical protein
MTFCSSARRFVARKMEHDMVRLAGPLLLLLEPQELLLA